MNVGSLFTGIGGFDLGLERAGMRVVWQCEQDAYCQRVLAKHWPGVPCHPDVRALVADTARNGSGEQAQTGAVGERVGAGDQPGSNGRPLPVPVPYVDILCGGFPCQDISLAGKGAGIDGERSGLWGEYARLIGELRPRYVIVENVAALLTRGLGRVVGDLAAFGYDAEWDCLPASAFGAPHRRDRLWLVAYPNDERGHGAGARTERAGRNEPENGGMEDAAGVGGCSRRQDSSESLGAGGFGGAGWQWVVEPDVGRVAHGVPARVDRLRSLGNALVPQIAEWIGRRIMDFER
jgi:DNA (cytosine-5)-methyltransferase 1